MNFTLRIMNKKSKEYAAPQKLFYQQIGEGRHYNAVINGLWHYMEDEEPYPYEDCLLEVKHDSKTFYTVSQRNEKNEWIDEALSDKKVIQYCYILDIVPGYIDQIGNNTIN